MTAAIVIVVIIAVIALGAYFNAQQTKRDREARVVSKFGNWRITPTELLVGDDNETCKRYLLAEAEASFDMSGSVSRDSGRYTMTRIALLGPLAIGAKKGRNKKIDDREGFLTIVGPEIGLMKTVKGPSFTSAQQFVLDFNKQVRMNEAGSAT